jgi:hypothetical protein
VPVNKITPYSGTWTEKQLRHLLVRTLFGVSKADLIFFKDKSLEQCLKILLRPIPLPPPPLFRTTDDPADLPEGHSFVFAAENKSRDDDWMLYLKGWWFGLMLEPQNNIREKMVLFWHNHFVVQFDTVKDLRYDYHYLNLLRTNALGNFKALLREITTCPAMLVYLNGNANGKKFPNENFGRELQELFTIGKGSGSNYTEADVKAAAKVLTGWKDDKKSIGSKFVAEDHNTDDKVFSAFYNHRIIKGRSGKEGAHETDELIQMICENAETANFLCRKLYRWFVHSKIDDNIEKNVITPLAEILRENDYEFKPVLLSLFQSSFFYEPELMGAMFKSPLDYFIGAAHQFKLQLGNKVEGWWLMVAALDNMGQSIGNPPNVAGWPAYSEFPLFDKNWVVSEYLSYRSRWIKGISYFEEAIYNPLPEPKLKFDFIGYVDQLPNANDPRKLVKSSLFLLCSIQPNKDQTDYLIKILDGEDNSWHNLWSRHKKFSADDKLKNEVYDRLRKVFNLILMLPEYQIM